MFWQTLVISRNIEDDISRKLGWQCWYWVERLTVTEYETEIWNGDEASGKKTTREIGNRIENSEAGWGRNKGVASAGLEAIGSLTRCNNDFRIYRYLPKDGRTGRWVKKLNVWANERKNRMTPIHGVAKHDHDHDHGRTSYTVVLSTRNKIEIESARILPISWSDIIGKCWLLLQLRNV